jgi:hypothetical protein
MSVVLRRLTPSDLAQLIPLNRELFSADFHMADDVLAGYLIAAVLKGRNHSVGAFDNGRMVGFMTITRRSSELDPEEWVISWDITAIKRKYRRSLVIPIMKYALRESLLSGETIEFTMRATTSYLTVIRNSALYLRYGYRIVLMAPREPIGKEKMTLVRFEHIFSRDRVLRPWYRAVTRLYCAGYVALALPRRALRRLCERVRYERVPASLRRLTFMELAIEQAVPAGS